MAGQEITELTVVGNQSISSIEIKSQYQILRERASVRFSQSNTINIPGWSSSPETKFLSLIR